jgi:hypothetical protein
MMNKYMVFLLLFILLFSQRTWSGNAGLAFLKIGIDARAVAMGEAYSAVCNDAAATYWNPAGLAWATSNSVSIMHQVWLQDINHEFLSAHLFQGRHNIALAVNLIQIPDIALRGEQASEEPTGLSSATNMYLGLNYATVIGKDWSVGGQLKYVSEKYYLTAAEGIALDVGIRRRNILTNLDGGLSIQNLGKMNKLRSVATPLPLILRVGASYRLPWEVLHFNPLTAADLYVADNNLSRLSLGIEAPVVQSVSLRAGYLVGGDSHRFTAGFGIQYGQANLAYAFVPYRYGLGQSHLFSFMIYY